MEKKLPNVFVNNGAKKIMSNNRKIYYSLYDSQNETILKKNPNTNQIINNLSIRKKVNDIFASTTFIYKARVLVTTKEEGMYKATIISKTPNYLITINNKKIKYEDIIDIKVIK